MVTGGPSASPKYNESLESGCSYGDLQYRIERDIASLNDAIEDVDINVRTAKEAVKFNREAMVNVIDDSTNAIVTDIDNFALDLKTDLRNHVTMMEGLLDRLQKTFKVVPEPGRQKLIDEIKTELETQVSGKHSTRPVIKFYPSAISRRILSGLYKVGILRTKRSPEKTVKNFQMMKSKSKSKQAYSSHDYDRCCDEDTSSSSPTSLSSWSLTSSVEDINFQTLCKENLDMRHHLLASACYGQSDEASRSNFGLRLKHRSVEELSYTSDLVSQSEARSHSDNCAYPIAKSKLININQLSAKTTSVKDSFLATNLVQNITHDHNESENDDGHEKRPLSCRFFDSFKTKRHRTPCVIPDLTWLDDGRFVLADHYHNNIQLFDENMVFITEEPCAYPMGVCSIDTNVVAVSLRRNGSIALYKVETVQLTLMRSINAVCEYYLWNVVYKSACLYVMCDENNVHNLDLYGIRRRVIRTGIPTECGYIRYFDVSDNGLLLFLCTEKGLICINRQGEHLWKFSTENLPFGVKEKIPPTLESVHYYDNRLLATHWTQSVIVEISTNGKYVKHLITGGIQNPRAIDIRNGKLAVTQFHPTMKESRKRTVKVFKILSD